MHALDFSHGHRWGQGREALLLARSSQYPPFHFRCRSCHGMSAGTRAFYWLSIALLLITLVVHAGTFMPSAAPVPKVVLFLLYAGIVATFLSAIRAVMPMVRDVPHRQQQKLLHSYLSRTHRALFLLVLAYLFFNFLFTMLYLNEGYTPDRIDGAYVLQDHGHVKKVITEEAYWKHSRYQQRALTGHPIFFQVVAMSMLLARLRWDRRAA